MRVSAALAALLIFCAGAGRAAEPTGPSCTHGAAAALGEIACELGRSVGAAARGALVVATPPTAEGGTRPAAELGTRMATLLSGALGSGATAWPSAESAARGRTLGAGARPVLLLETRLHGDRIEVTADVFVGRERFWKRVRGARSGPVAHGFAERALDAEVRAFLPKVPLVAREVRKLRGLDPDVVALACGDLTFDGEPEIATVGRQRVTLGRVRGDRFEPIVSRAWGELEPVAPMPLREPIASAWIPNTGVLELGSSDRTRALRLDAGLREVLALDARLPWPGGGCASIAMLAVLPEPARCRASDPPSEPFGLGEPVDAFGGALIVARDGHARIVRAGRRASDATLVVLDGAKRTELPHAGAQLALGDLDGDGALEIATSLDTLEPGPDALLVYSWLGTELKERLRLPLPGGIRALAMCPARALAMGPIVAATRDALWLVR